MEQLDIGSLNFNTDELAANALRARTEIDKLSGEISKARKESRESQKVIDLLTQANERLAESGEESSESFQENKKEIEKLNKSIENNTKTIVENESKKRNLNKEQREINKILDLQTKAQKDNTLAVEQSNAILTETFSTQQEAYDLGSAMMALRKRLNPAIEEEAELMEKLSKRVDEANEFQDLYNTKNEERVKGIGKYTESIIEAIKETSGLNDTFKKGGSSSDLFSNGITGAIGGIGGLSKATTAFTAIPLITVVTLLVKGFQFLYEKFKETQGGMDALTKITRPLMAIFDSLMGVAQDLAISLVKMATEPKKALSDFVDFVKNNAMNRLKAFGVIIEAIQNRDFKALRNGIAQGITGVENLEDKIINGAKATKQFMQEAYDKGVQLDQIQKEIENREIALSLRSKEITTEMKAQKLIADDTTKSAEQRTAAIAEQTKLAQELAQHEQGILDLKIKQEEITQSLNDTSRKDEKRLNELKGEREETENRLTETIAQNLGVEKELRTQLANQAKEARKERINALLEEKNAALDLFILRNEGMQESLQEEIDFFRDIQDQKSEILKKQMENDLMSKVAYETEIEKLQIETNKKEAEAVVFYATEKLNAEISNLQKIQSERKRFSDESFEEEKNLLEAIKNEDLRIAKERVEAGLITRNEYNDYVLELETESQTKMSELDKAFETQRSEDRKLARLLENEAILMGIDEQFELEQEKLNQQRELKLIELSEQREQGLISEQNYLESLKNLNQEYAKDQEKIDEAVADNKVNLMSDAFGNISSILGKNSTEGKFFASAQAAVDTYAAANKALAAYPPPFSYIAAGAAIVQGLGNVAKINSIKTQKYDGGYTGDGGMFTRTGYNHAGEVVFNQQDVKQLGGVNAVERIRPTSGSFSGMPTGNGNLTPDSVNWSAIASILGDNVRTGSMQGVRSGISGASDDARVKEMATF